MSIVNMEFIEPEFYKEPPTKDADVKTWAKWMTEEKQARSNHKRSYTKALNLIADQTGEDYTPDLPSEISRKVGGVYKQGQPVAFSGDSEQGTSQAEPAQDAQANKLAILNRWAETDSKRGTKSASKSKRQRAARAKNKRKG